MTDQKSSLPSQGESPRPTKASAEAIRHAKAIRVSLIDLSYELPSEPSQAILEAWTAACSISSD